MPSPKSPHEMFQVMKANIVEKTGKPLEAWTGLAKKSGITKFKALTDHMKAEFGVSHGYAQLIAWSVLDPARLEAGNKDQGMVDDLYTGDRGALRPIHDRLLGDGTALGSDVDTVICKTYTSLRSRSQFAIVVPRTKSAVDLELAMPPGTKTSDRLQPFKSSNPRFTHRIRINDTGEIDSEVTAALTTAWEHNRSV